MLSIFAVYLGYNVRQKLILVKNIENKSKLGFAAEAGVKKAIIEIKNRKKDEIFTLSHELASNPAFRGMSIGDERLDVSYNYYNLAGNKLGVRYGLIDEESKININIIDWQVLKRLFINVLGVDESTASDLACSIIDWRDNDSVNAIPGFGAENSYYTMLQYPYEAKNKDFEVLAELLLVKGINQELFDKVEDFITIYSTGKININTASGPVLMALGLNPELVNKILVFRCGKDKIEGTPDDNIFSSALNIAAQLSQPLNLSPEDKVMLDATANNYLSTESNYFNIDCAAVSNNQRVIKEIVSVVDSNGKIMSWREL